MSDIVERLRKAARMHYARHEHELHGVLQEEAADEIVRLRSVLRDLVRVQAQDRVGEKP